MEPMNPYKYYTPYYNPTYSAPFDSSSQLQSSRPAPLQWYWIQGGADTAKNWSVTSGSTVALWDSDEQIIYLKSTDLTGRPTIQTLDYTIRESVSAPSTSYVTKNELDAFFATVEELKTEIENLKEAKK